MPDIRVKAKLTGGIINAKAELGKIVEVPVGPDVYTGEYNIPLTDEDTVLATKGKLLEEDVTIEGAHGKKYTLDDLASGSEPSGDIVITTTSLNSQVFYESQIRSITAPYLTTIAYPNAFQGCDSLLSVNMPALTTLESNGAFADCRYLETVNLPNLTNLKSATFQSTMYLRELWLPKVVKIEGSPFYGRTGWQVSKNSVLKLGSIVTSMSATAFLNFCNSPGDIYVIWAEGEVAGAPWRAPTGTTIHYNTVFDEEGNIISSD